MTEPTDDAATGARAATPTNDPAACGPTAFAPKIIRSELARRGRLPFDECLRISLALTIAPDPLHRHDLVHRDTQPANVIFLNRVAKLADIYSRGKVLYEVSTGRD